jgi:hypothetical protein
MNGKIISKKHLAENGEWEERKQFFLDGEEVTEAEFLDAFPDKEIAGGVALGAGLGSGWPMVGEALAVHPKQVQEANERNKRHGVNVSYCPQTGRALIPDEGAYRKLRRLEGKHFNNAFYD